MGRDGAGAYLNDARAELDYTLGQFFSNRETLRLNRRSGRQQRKAIKYNHLVANCLIFHNLSSLTGLVQTLEQRGESIPEDAIAAISPYLTEHINRFGDYTLNLDRKRPSQTMATP